MPGPLDSMEDRRKMSNALRKMYENDADKFTQQLLDEDITLQQWQSSMRDLIREAHVQQFITGTGGAREDINLGDFGQLGPVMRSQYEYLQGFADKLLEDDAAGVSTNYAKWRARLYVRTAQSSFWRSAVPVALPQRPRDGNTVCRSNCKCHLEFDYETNDEGRRTAVLVSWELGSAEHCRDCIQLAREWDPLRLPITSQQSSISQSVILFIVQAVEENFFESELLDVLKWQLKYDDSWPMSG